jgi:hypothetical protein
MKIVPFEPRTDADAEHNQQMVMTRLQEALEMARAGSVRSVAIVMMLDAPDSSIVDCWHNGGQPYIMLGAIESLKVDFLNAAIDRR